jgi:hypothetical protein
MDILHILLRPTRALRSPFTRASSFLLSSSVTPALSFVPNDISFIPHIVPSHSLPWTHIHHYQRPVEPPIPPQINKLTRVPPFAPRPRTFIGVRRVAGGCGTLEFREDRCTGGVGRCWSSSREKLGEQKRGLRLTQYELNGWRRGFTPRRYNT